jgi:hypothetical protein
VKFYLTPGALPELEGFSHIEARAILHKVDGRAFRHWQTWLGFAFMYGTMAAAIIGSWAWIHAAGPRIAAWRAAFACCVGGLPAAPVAVHVYLAQSRRYVRQCLKIRDWRLY